MVADSNFREEVFLALSKPRAGNEGATPKSFVVVVEEINHLIFDFLWETREAHRRAGRGVSLKGRLDFWGGSKPLNVVAGWERKGDRTHVMEMIPIPFLEGDRFKPCQPRSSWRARRHC